MNSTTHILCAEHDQPLVRNRCKVLQAAGYDKSQATPKLAEIILSGQKFDLIVVSNATEIEMNRIVNVTDGADVLVLSDFTSRSELSTQFADRVERVRTRRP